MSNNEVNIKTAGMKSRLTCANDIVWCPSSDPTLTGEPGVNSAAYGLNTEKIQF